MHAAADSVDVPLSWAVDEHVEVAEPSMVCNSASVPLTELGTAQKTRPGTCVQTGSNRRERL